MTLAIIGSRSFNNESLLDTIITRYFCIFDNNCFKPGYYPSFDKVVSGGAKGADSLGVSYIRKYFVDIPIVEHLPDWDKYGKRAGFIRNELIVKDCNFLLSFWDGISKGTQNSLSLAKKYKKPTMVIYF